MLVADMSNHRCDGRPSEADNKEHVELRQVPSHLSDKGCGVLVSETKDRKPHAQTATVEGRGDINADAGRGDSLDAKEVGGGGVGQVFPRHPTLTLRDIARIAYTEGMTAHEAADKFGVNVLSVRKVVCKHKMPRLLTDQDKHIMRQLKNMNDTQLKSYWNALQLPKNMNGGKTEREHVKKELELRNLKA